MKKILTAVAMLSIVLMIVLQPIALAWMSDNGMSSPIDITTNVHKSYFESGNGTKESPYEIKYPIQFYYFAWLQYLGHFNKDSDGNDKIDTTFYFRVSADIDMKDLQAESENGKLALPPIGTTDNPFIGNFDGEGHTIKNLTVENQYSSLIDPPDGTDSFKGAEIIGCFGVVGELIVDNPTVEYDYDTQANEVKNVILENLTVKTQTNQALIGLVAGYVNGTVDRVGVVSSTVDIAAGTKPLNTDKYTSNISDYSLIGYCTEEYRDSVYTLNLSLKAPGLSDGAYNVVPDMTGDGSQQGWGGSVKMSDIYAWLTEVSSNADTVSFVTERVDVVDLNGKTVTLSSSTANRDVYTVNEFGSFVFTDSQPNYVNFVSGSSKVTKYEYVRDDKSSVPLYYITDGTYYLCYNNGNITSTTDRNQATAWYISNGTNGGSIYTVVDGDVRYLTIEGNTITTQTNTLPDDAPTWVLNNGDLRYNSQKIECNNGTWRVATASSYLIASGSHYLSVSSNYGNVSISDQTNSSNATEWNLNTTGTTTTISTVVNGTTYYLSTNNSNNLTLTTTSTTWNYDATNVRLSRNNRYLRYSGGWSTGSRSTSTGTNLTLTGIWDDSLNNTIIQSSGTNAAKITVKTTEYIDNDLINGTYDANGVKQGTNAGITYFPLTSDVVWNENETAINSFGVSSNNTGYIIGADWDIVDREAHPDRIDSNIRISRYTHNDAGITFEQAKVPYAISHKTKGAFSQLPAIPTKESELTEAQRKTLSDLGLAKYASCYGDYLTSVEGAWNGIHFMNAPISASNVAKITADLRGRTIENYEVPLNCIDFNLYESGFINTVAGSYYKQGGGNTSFFSIYEVIRDKNNECDITEIREIYKIYGKLTNGNIDTSVPYIYTYYDSTHTQEVGKENVPVAKEGETPYEVIFDCDWITKTEKKNISGWADSRVYYFEVPVNAGEYAIGSTQGENGAYLVYLDLAANAQLIKRDKQYEEITENSASATIPNGVDLLDPKAENFGLTLVDPSNSAFASIGGTTSGKITYDKDGNAVVVDPASGITAEYVGVGGKLVDKNGNVMTVPWTSETVIKRTTYRDNNINTGVFTVTVIDEIHVTEGGKETISYKKHVTTTYPTGHEDYPDGAVVEKDYPEQSEPLYPDDPDKDAPTVAAGEDKLIDIAFSYGSDVNLTVSYEYVPAEKDESGKVTADPKYIITITNGGTEAVKIKAILTEVGTKSGITFVITDGTTETTLNANTNEQIVEIAASADNGETGGDTGTEGA